jgi:ABC-type uncharacterized transport system auxiliary subunit
MKHIHPFEKSIIQGGQLSPRNVNSSQMIWIAVLLAVAIAGFTGCASTKPNKYYQLGVPNSAAIAPSINSGVTLTVANLSATNLYQQDGIVYTAIAGHMGIYGHDRWTAAPADALQEVLMRSLRASGRYRGVYMLRNNPMADFVIHGRIHDFREVDLAKNSILARVSFDLELRDRKNGNTVWTHYYTHDEPVSGKDLNAVVAAFDKNVQRGIGEVTAGLEQYFASHPMQAALDHQ